MGQIYLLRPPVDFPPQPSGSQKKMCRFDSGWLFTFHIARYLLSGVLLCRRTVEKHCHSLNIRELGFLFFLSVLAR